MNLAFYDFPAGERLSDRWQRHAELQPDATAIVHWSAIDDPVRWTWGHLVERATAIARKLVGAGVRPGQVCAIIIRHHPEFYPVYLAAEWIGAIPAVLAYPNPRLHPDKFRDGLRGMARHSGLDWILTEPDLEPLIASFISERDSTVRGLIYPLSHSSESPAKLTSPFHGSSHEPCLLQHSSGTTGLQKAVVLSHDAVLGHIRRYGQAILLTPDDRVVSWLPLYHDMGLIAAFHLSLAFGIPLIQLDPFEWIQAPSIMLDAASQERATLAWLPNFAFHLMAERVRDGDLDGVRLESLRLLVNCSEPVRADAHEKFIRRFVPFGLAPTALSACYAMAETTFAVTQTVPGVPPTVLTVNRKSLESGLVQDCEVGPNARACVSSGRPIEGCTVRVVDPQGNDLPDKRVGELLIRSTSLFNGYRNNPEQTAKVLRDGEYSSGDYGFTRNGEVFVIGRKKDLIIVAGKNIYPEDVEDAANGIEGVIPGRVIAFAIDDPAMGTEAVAVAAESESHDAPAKSTIEQNVILAGMGIGVTVSKVFLVPPRWLIKSSAGKPSRSANRERLLALYEGPSS